MRKGAIHQHGPNGTASAVSAKKDSPFCGHALQLHFLSWSGDKMDGPFLPLPSSLIFGALYQFCGPLVAFGWGAALALVAGILILGVKEPRTQAT